jgi:hypothetical protein
MLGLIWQGAGDKQTLTPAQGDCTIAIQSGSNQNIPLRSAN